MELGQFETLAATAVVGLSDAELLDVARAATRLSRQLQAVTRDVVAEIDQRGLGLSQGYPRVAQFLSDVLREPSAVAKAMVQNARDAGPLQSMQGEPLAPVFPAVAAAQDAGEISLAHVKVIVDTVGAIPFDLQAENDRKVEAQMVEFAKQFNPDYLRALGRDIIAKLDTDGKPDDENEIERRRGLDVHTRADGSATIRGELTAECTELLLTVFNTLGAPKKADGEPDPRGARQRRHDALRDGLELLIKADFLPRASGVKATLVLFMEASDYLNRTGSATTANGCTISTPEALRWATDDHELFAALLGKNGELVSYSTGHRLFSPAQRRAIVLRDKGCTFPGCEAPPGWCEVHHVVEHQAHGPTAVDNAALVCRFHHAHFDAMGWQCVMLDGIPHWIPPVSIDPEQSPRVNPLHRR